MTEEDVNVTDLDVGSKRPYVEAPEEARAAKKRKLDDEDYDYEDDDYFAKPQKLTKRQQAMVSEETQPQMQALPMEIRKRLSDSDKLKKAERSRKRRRQEQRAQEMEQKAVIDRLLHKVTKKQKRSKRTEKHMKSMKEGIKLTGPVVCLSHKVDGSFLSVSSGCDALDGLWVRKAMEPVAAVSCSAPGCQKAKRYQHKASGRPVCSLTCYKAIEA